MGIIRQHQTQKQPFRRGVLFFISERRLGHNPEGFAEVEFLNLFPHCGGIVEIQVRRLQPGVKNGLHETEEVVQVRFRNNGDHLAIQIRSRVIWRHKTLQPLKALLRIKELPSVGDVSSQHRVHEPEFLAQNARPVSPEAAAVEPDVQEPVSVIIRLFRWRVEQELPVGRLSLHPNLHFQRSDLIKSQHRDAVEQDVWQRVLKFPLRVVPEDDSVPLFVEEAFERRVDLVHVAHSSSLPPVMAFTSASKSPNFP
ncbi:MAG: hypothetical protein JW395_3527 [Nitrospira sp.]|nr:hypothetical protein [Nitrospira sp.]